MVAEDTILAQWVPDASTDDQMGESSRRVGDF
jgi:hypothetical protein